MCNHTYIPDHISRVHVYFAELRKNDRARLKMKPMHSIWQPLCGWQEVLSPLVSQADFCRRVPIPCQGMSKIPTVRGAGVFRSTEGTSGGISMGLVPIPSAGMKVFRLVHALLSYKCASHPAEQLSRCGRLCCDSKYYSSFPGHEVIFSILLSIESFPEKLIMSPCWKNVAVF